MDALFELAKLVIAGAVGGTVMPILTHAQERRTARAAVREHLTTVELSRGPSDGDWSQVRNALAVFEANALAAGLHKDLVTIYKRLVLVAWATIDNERRSYHELISVGIPVELSELVETAHGHLVDAMWHPWRSKFRRKTRIKDLEERVKKLQEVKPTYIVWSAWKRSLNF